MVRLHISLVLVVALTACGSGVTPVGGDGAVDGSSSDMGVRPDSGGGDSGNVDSGSTGTDAGDVDSGDVDSGSTGTDAGDVDSGDVDSGSTGTDAGDVDSGTTGTDSGMTGTDSGTTGTDSGTTGTDAAMSCAGTECTGFPTTFVRGCTVDDNCVGEIHQVDCCGASRALGMNHAEAATFCPAEYGISGPTTGCTGGCRNMYPSPPGCTDTTITTDTGATANDVANVAVHCVMGSTGTTGTCTTFVCGTAGGTPCPASRRIGSCACS